MSELLRDPNQSDFDLLGETIREAAFLLPESFLRKCGKAPVTIAASVFAATIAARLGRNAELSEVAVKEIARDSFSAARIFLREAEEQGGAEG